MGKHSVTKCLKRSVGSIFPKAVLPRAGVHGQYLVREVPEPVNRFGIRDHGSYQITQSTPRGL